MLSETEKGMTEFRRAHNLSCTEIEKSIGRHRITVYNYLKQKVTCKQQKKINRPLLSERTSRSIVCQAVQCQQTVLAIEKLELKVHVCSIRRVLFEQDNV